MKHIGDWARNQNPKMPFKEAAHNPRLPKFPENLKEKDGPNKNFLRYYYTCGRKWDWDKEKEENMKEKCNYFAWADRVIDKSSAINSMDNVDESDALAQVFYYGNADKVYKFDNMYLPDRLVNQVENVISKWRENELERERTQASEGESKEGLTTISEERVEHSSITAEHSPEPNEKPSSSRNLFAQSLPQE